RPFHAILEPVEAVVPAGQRPTFTAEAPQKVERSLQRIRLVQLESRHHISGHRSLRSQKGPVPPGSAPFSFRKRGQTPFVDPVFKPISSPSSPPSGRVDLQRPMRLPAAAQHVDDV